MLEPFGWGGFLFCGGSYINAVHLIWIIIVPHRKTHFVFLCTVLGRWSALFPLPPRSTERGRTKLKGRCGLQVPHAHHTYPSQRTPRNSTAPSKLFVTQTEGHWPVWHQSPHCPAPARRPRPHPSPWSAQGTIRIPNRPPSGLLDAEGGAIRD